MTIFAMRFVASALLSSSILGISAFSAAADCGDVAGRVSIVGNDFPAIHSVVKAATAACEGGKVTVKSNLTADHQKINLPGMQGNPAEYTAAIVATSSIVPLMNADVIRPLDDLIAKYGQDIPKRQLITANGKVIAVAFMANAQHLVYRDDVLKKVGMEPPKTYEQFLEAAEKIRAAGIMKNPVGGAYATGYNLGLEFINIYNGMGGEFFKDGTATASIKGEQGVKTLELMKKLTGYMNPDFLTHDSNATAAEWEAGNVALMNFWGSRTGVLVDKVGSAPEVYENTKVGAPMTVAGGKTPASALWWDGWTVARNISDADAAATFVALKNGTSSKLLNETTMGQAVWMIEGYKPAAVNQGVMQTMASGARPYPMLPYMGLLHAAIGENVARYLSGKTDAQTALSDIEATYSAAAKEKGFLK
ncbi:ABC transporter substrate-binding protein [Rhizobium sp. SSA_523]|uniref:ABC transporter substrate-binding protein n=1 Tax=Rhizobium sp. SSA_523 TaxID=2952477 RepID=UPI0020903A71|nr:extracellular solute-binding protein [Rhizobium sp. SSA_523]MCO5733348.1 extracellular solute-binding protein [Rhizobium sp. SSA_523]WKC21673.1 extracellular solute-binding protein [Rhizobium sp. SSA_523]